MAHATPRMSLNRLTRSPSIHCRGKLAEIEDLSENLRIELGAIGWMTGIADGNRADLTHGYLLLNGREIGGRSDGSVALGYSEKN
ncbi:hypothetical protein [Egbenema bharatensis]|uniref:hypothetical protein n=1 Tax=Egbenema bharatensis TaxID=3463334 RepID=UPI003A86FDAA